MFFIAGASPRFSPWKSFSREIVCHREPSRPEISLAANRKARIEFSGIRVALFSRPPPLSAFFILNTPAHGRTAPWPIVKQPLLLVYCWLAVEKRCYVVAARHQRATSRLRRHLCALMKQYVTLYNATPAFVVLFMSHGFILDAR